MDQVDQNFENVPVKKESVESQAEQPVIDQPAELSPAEPSAETPYESRPMEPAEEFPVQQTSPQADDQAEIQAHAESIAPLPQEEQVQKLLLLASEKGVDKAVAVAKKLDNPALQDAFHDMIMDNPEFKAQLEASGKLEKLWAGG